MTKINVTIICDTPGCHQEVLEGSDFCLDCNVAAAYEQMRCLHDGDTPDGSSSVYEVFVVDSKELAAREDVRRMVEELKLNGDW